MKKHVDARGLSCPEPVLLTRQVLQDQVIQEITVLVDNKVAVENITRIAENSNCQVKVTKQDSDFMLTLIKTK